MCNMVEYLIIKFIPMLIANHNIASPTIIGRITPNTRIYRISSHNWIHIELNVIRKFFYESMFYAEEG